MKKKVKETLMKVVTKGSLKTVKNAFSEHKLEFNESFFDYDLLKAALLRKHYPIISFLLREVGCRAQNPNKNDREESVLHLALHLNIIQNKVKLENVVNDLIKNGASIYAKNSKGETPLQAAFNEKIYLPRQLMHFDSNFDPKNKDDILHFHIACVTNHYPFAERYLKCGLDPNIPISIDSEKYSHLNPIQFAIEKSYFKLFKRLVRHGGDLSITNTKGLTPLHMIYYSKKYFPKNAQSWIKIAFKHGNETKFIISKDKYLLTHFHLSCIVNNPQFVQVFIENGVNVNNSISLKCRFNAGFTPLHFAVKNGCEEVVKVLLKNGADPNKADVWGKTPLHLAFVKAEYLSNIIEILLDYNSCCVIQDKKGCTPLHKLFYFMNHGAMKLAKKIISKIKWGSTNVTDNQGVSLFHIACAINDLSQVKKFLDSGVNIDSCVTSGIYKGFTALHFAVIYNQEDVVQELLTRNANVNVKSHQLKISPLHLACEINDHMVVDEENKYKCHSHQMDVIKSLLLHGADVNSKDFLGITPLLHTCMVDKNYCKRGSSDFNERSGLNDEVCARIQDIIEILIENKANVNARTVNQCSMLHIISKYRTIKISNKFIKFLANSGVDLDATDLSGLTPLHVAAIYKNNNLVKVLLKNYANPNIKCKNSEIPLNIIVKKLTCEDTCYVTDSKIVFDIFVALLESDSDVNVKYKNGETMLYRAMKNLRPAIVEKLLEYGANVSSKKSFYFSISLATRRMPEIRMLSDAKLFSIAFVYIQKRLALRLPVNKIVQKYSENQYSVFKRYPLGIFDLPDLSTIFDNCIEELERMRNNKIDHYTSLYDILLKNPQDLVKHVKNIKLIKILEDKKTKKIYKMYYPRLQLQFYRGLMRRHVIQSAETALSRVLNTNLPNSCYDRIVGYLSNDEVSNLKEAAAVKQSLSTNEEDANLSTDMPINQSSKKKSGENNLSESVSLSKKQKKEQGS